MTNTALKRLLISKMYIKKMDKNHYFQAESWKYVTNRIITYFSKKLKVNIHLIFSDCFQPNFQISRFEGMSGMRLRLCFDICKHETTHIFETNSYLWQENQLFTAEPPDIFSPFCGDQNRCFKTNHDLFLNLAKWIICAKNLDRA